MTKRFTGHDIYNGVNEHFQFYDNNKRISNKEVLELLNNLNDENERLQKRIYEIILLQDWERCEND